VQFVNDPTATAPAQTVIVTEQLDSNLDWNSFQLGDIGFGGFLVNVPAGHSSYQTVVNAVNALDLYVQVSANLDLNTGLITWTFTSLDPATLQPTSDPLAGFLPPDDAEGDGEGFVSYSVQPKSTVSRGPRSRHRRRSYFDTNASNRHQQRDEYPGCRRADQQRDGAAGAGNRALDFLVSWSGLDDAGGIGSRQL